MLGNIRKVVFVRVEGIRVSEAWLKWLNGIIGPRIIYNSSVHARSSLVSIFTYELS